MAFVYFLIIKNTIISIKRSASAIVLNSSSLERTPASFGATAPQLAGVNLSLELEFNTMSSALPLIPILLVLTSTKVLPSFYLYWIYAKSWLASCEGGKPEYHVNPSHWQLSLTTLEWNSNPESGEIERERDRKCGEKSWIDQSASRRLMLLHWQKEVIATSLLIVNITTCVACITPLTNGLK